MENSQFVEDDQTFLDSNWILDRSFITEQKGILKKENNYILDAVNTEINIPKTGNGSLIEEDNMERSNDKDNYSSISEFFLPNFSEKINLDFQNYFSKTQKWVGYVEEIKDREFTAKLYDVNKPGTYETGDFSFDDVSLEDRKLLTIGAVFYWSVGQEVRNSQVYNQSLIRFKRVPNWSVAEIDSTADRADYLSKNLKWE